MSNENDDPRVSDVTDSEVSRAYRDIATERAPASLNERVLRDARSHTKGGYSHAVRWLRPLAWAATVGLSLAIVIQLTVLPGVESPDLSLPQSAPDTGSAGRRDGIAVDEPDRRVATEAATPAEELPGDTAPSGGAAMTASDAFAITDAPMLEQARDMAAKQSATEREAGAAVAEPAKQERLGEHREAQVIPATGEDVAADRAPEVDAPAARVRQMQTESAFVSTTGVASAAAATADDSLCDEIARAMPETWLECIEALRRAGRDEDADAEVERLTEAFPGFDIR